MPNQGRPPSEKKDASSTRPQIVTQEMSKHLVPPILNVSDLTSSELLHITTNNSHMPKTNICNQPELHDLSVELSRESSEQLSPAMSPKHFEKVKLVDPAMKTSLLLFQIPLLPQPHLVSRLAPPISPKPRTRSETSVESAGRNSLLLRSPASPSRKYFKVVSSPVLSAGKRRDSEPVLEGMSRSGFQHKQLSVTDKRWEKLRSILVAMKNEPCDVDEIQISSSPELLNNLQEKISAQKEQFALQKELSYMQDALQHKEFKLQQAEAERDSALAYIRHLKANLTDAGDKSTKLYEQGIENLRESSISKENVIDMLSPMVKELHEQKSYLDCLMTVVLMRAPWMLDEVDKMELPNGQHFFSQGDDVEGDDFQYEDSDSEVWC